LNKTFFSSPIFVAIAVMCISVVSFSIEALFALVFVIGVWRFFQRQRIDNPATKIVLFGFFVLIWSRLPSLFVVESPVLELKRLATAAHFFLAAFVFLGLYDVQMARWRLMLGAVFGSFLVWAALILPKVMAFDASLGHIVFAHSQIDAIHEVAQNRLVASTVLGALVLTGLVFLLRHFSEMPQRLRWLMGACWLIGLTTLVSTQARGPIVATLLVGSIIICVMLVKKRVSGRVFLLVCSIFLLACFLLLGAGFERIAVTMQDIGRYFQGSASTETAISIRLEMWKASVDALRAKPLFGYGISGAVKAVDALTAYNISTFNHLHNEFLDTMVSHGLVGLFGLGFMFSCLLKIAFQWWRSEQWHLGVLLGGFSVYWGICGLSNIAFRQGLLNSFFIIFICILLIVHRSACLDKPKTVI
jgi:O-antigen ligase